MPLALPRRSLPSILVLGLLLTTADGPARGASLKVPDGFEARLVAAVPAVQYPCQVATAPGRRLFVAEDPMDQIGPYESSHGRILLFVNDQDPAVFAEGFRAIQGMAWHDDALYVCHMPFLTVVRDLDGDGKADRKTDLFQDLGSTANQGLNDHIVSGIQFGMDGYLYISVGDKGVPAATRPEDGAKIQLKGGGTLRCRPDGTGLEVYSSGTRNHLEPNLDDRDNLFTYDNTDDGDGWWTRVTHHVDGGYYGYPYDYHDRPDRYLPRMAEYGGGSPCGAVVYKEDAWPEPWRNVGIWAEWGKGKVQAFRFAPDGSTFKVAEVIDFALPDGLSNFRPIDLAFSYDGSTLYVADWGMGGWGNKTEKVGRVYAITYTTLRETRPRGQDSDPLDVQIKQLDHPSFNERMRAQAAIVRTGRDALGQVVAALTDAQTDPVARRHLLWALDGIAGGLPEATTPLIDLLDDQTPDLRAQAARALGERRVPIAPGPLTALLNDPEPTVRLQAVIALGRIGDPKAVASLLPALADADPFTAFSARQALRRINAWSAAAVGLDSPGPTIRLALLAAMEEQYEPEAVAALAGFASDSDRPAVERARALAYLAQVHHKAKSWDGKWWGTRPTHGKPPAKELDWDGTPIVLKTVRDLLADPQVAVRRAAVQAVRDELDHEALPLLRARFAAETDLDARRELALAFSYFDNEAALPMLISALSDPNTPEPVRDASLIAVGIIGGNQAARALIDLLDRADVSNDRLPKIIQALVAIRSTEAIPQMLARLDSPDASVRAALVEGLGKIGRAEGVSARVLPLIGDPDLAVRKAAIAAAAALNDREAVPPLMAAALKDETRFEADMALTRIADVRALQVYLRALSDKNQDLRKAAARALATVRDQAAPILDQLAGRNELPPSALPELRKIFVAVQPIRSWQVLGPFPTDAKPPVDPESVDLQAKFKGKDGQPVAWKPASGTRDTGMVDLGKIYNNGAQFAYAYAEIQSGSQRKAELVVGSDDTLTVWLNEGQVYDFSGRRSFNAEQDRREVTLAPGVNRVLAKCGNFGGSWQFSAGVTEAADHAFLASAPNSSGFNPDAYRGFALKHKGDAGRGRALFTDLKGLACMKCHAVNGEGGAVGPDLSSVGALYARDELIRSVLYPSARIFSGYEPVTVATVDGRVLTGVVKSDGDDALEIQDAEANRITIPKEQIEDRKTSDVSLMPGGLAEGLTPQDFADVIAFLETLKQTPPAAQPAGGP